MAMTQRPSKHYWLYVLRLEHGKYYVGITSKKNPYDRINEHKNGFYTAQWVKRHKMIEHAEVIELGDITETEAKHREDDKTLQYMKKYGYQNVRGGKFNYSGKYAKIGDLFLPAERFVMALGVIYLLGVMLFFYLRQR